MKNHPSVLFLGKQDDLNCASALAFCERHFPGLDSCLGRTGEPLPEEVARWGGTLLISYRSPWIVPGSMLQYCQHAINFHPGPPKYPGTGCVNFALYEGAEWYGVTCHHMTERVDEGAIIHADHFPIYPEDDVASLLERAHAHLLRQLFDVLDYWRRWGEFPEAPEKWSGKKHTRAELDELARITPEMDSAEVARRVRATSYGPWQPFVELAGHRFEYRPR